jgi:hypothetical protein
MTPTYNEKAGVELKARFYEQDQRTPAVPNSIHYRIDCETTNQTLLDWTELSPSTIADAVKLLEVYVEIDIPGSLNAIQKDRNSRELKKVLVVSNKDTASEYSEEYEYYVRNVRGRS